MKKLSFLWLWFLCIFFFLLAWQPLQAQPVDSTTKSLLLEQARKEIDTLCSSTFAGRGYIAEGHKKAAAYLRDRFKEIGLQAVVKSVGSNQRKYEQHFPIRINLASAASVQINEQELEAGTDFIVNKFSGSGKVSGKVVDIGYGLQLKKYKKVSGKIALIRAGWPEAVANDTEKKKQYASLARLSDRLAELKQLRPLGIIVIQKKLTAGFTRESIRLPVVEIAADRLPKKIKKAHLSVTSGIKNIRSQNVIGMIPGREIQDTVVIVSAHYDHLGKLEDAVFTGANDNASGTTMMLSMAAYFAKHPIRYTLIFIGFGGEETGLVGSGFYVNQQPLFPLVQTHFILNLDLMGNGIDGIMAVGGKDFPSYFDKLVSLNDTLQAVPKVRARKNAPNSDHYFFLANGVKGFFIYTLGGPPHYHDVRDNPSTIVLSRYAEVRELLIQFLANL